MEEELLLTWNGIVWSAIILGGTVFLGVVANFILFKVIGFMAKRTESKADESLVKHCRGPGWLIVPLFLCHIVLPLVELSPGALAFLRQAFSVLLTISGGWLVIRLSSVGEDLILEQYDIDVKDNLRARKVYTQIRVVRKVIIFVVVVITLGIVLMTFEKVRQLGTSILASAGIAGIVIGFAAQRSIANLLAGLQLAFTGPIHIDDVVVVEGEWGRIEEITLTYVVVRIWDLRRLILPITYFIEKPFQNWTRVSADILGTVFLYVDYTVPIQEVRDELKRLLENSEQWDGKVCTLQVTNSKENVVELRALMSAADSSAAWELRCLIREQLISFIQKNYPNSLPRMRAEIQGSVEK